MRNKSTSAVFLHLIICGMWCRLVRSYMSEDSGEPAACILHISPWRWKKLYFLKYCYISRRRQIQDDCNNRSIHHGENLMCNFIFPKRPTKPQSYIIAAENVFFQQIANISSTGCLCKLYSLCIIRRLASNGTKRKIERLSNLHYTTLFRLIVRHHNNGI